MDDRGYQNIERMHERIDELGNENKRLRAALVDARNSLHNDFEPDNQSRAWHRANAALEQSMPKSPAGDRGQIGWMGGENER